MNAQVTYIFSIQEIITSVYTIRHDFIDDYISVQLSNL